MKMWSMFGHRQSLSLTHSHELQINTHTHTHFYTTCNFINFEMLGSNWIAKIFSELLVLHNAIY